MNSYNVEYTDTFAGEANYAWVRRATVSVPERGGSSLKGYQASVMRKAKAAVGLSGVKGRTECCGEGFTFRPYRMATVLFVTYADQ